MLSSKALCDDLSLSLKVSPRICKIGNDLVFSLIYRNVADHSIGINPSYRAYEALDVKLLHVATGQQGKLVTYFPVGFEEEQVQRGFILLKPQQTYTVRHLAKVMSSLPKKPFPWSDDGRGLYIVFVDSALKLPAVGAYNVTTRYVAREASRPFLRGKDRKFWWVGEARAKSVQIEVRP